MLSGHCIQQILPWQLHATCVFRAAVYASCWMLFAYHLRPHHAEPGLHAARGPGHIQRQYSRAKFLLACPLVADPFLAWPRHVVNARVQRGSRPILGGDAWIRVQHQLHQIPGIYSMQSFVRPCGCNEGVSGILHHRLPDLPLRSSSEFNRQVLRRLGL